MHRPGGPVVTRKQNDQPTPEQEAEQPADRADAPHEPAEEPGRKDKESAPLFWRVFGGAVVGAVALLGITLYQHVARQTAELRQEISHLGRESKGDMTRLSENY